MQPSPRADTSRLFGPSLRTCMQPPADDERPRLRRRRLRRMLVFQSILILLVCAVLLTACARRFNLPYPSFLALGGTALAFIPNVPQLQLDPSLTLALFVAPALLDAAFDTSLRDLKRYW